MHLINRQVICKILLFSEGIVQLRQAKFSPNGVRRIILFNILEPDR